MAEPGNGRISLPDEKKWQIHTHTHTHTHGFESVTLKYTIPAAVAAAAAKSLQSCPTLCDPIDGSPPGTIPSGKFFGQKSRIFTA